MSTPPFLSVMRGAAGRALRSGRLPHLEPADIARDRHKLRDRRLTVTHRDGGPPAHLCQVPAQLRLQFRHLRCLVHVFIRPYIVTLKLLVGFDHGPWSAPRPCAERRVGRLP